MGKTLEERIREAREEWAYLRERRSLDGSRDRLIVRAEKRLADLVAVQEGKAVEVHSTMSVNWEGAYDSVGCAWVEAGATEDPHTQRKTYDSGDRITILRGIAYKPITTPDESEAESEVSS